MERKTLDELPSWAADLLDEARVARLGLLDDEDGVRGSFPVTFAVQAGSLWTAVDRKPKRDPAIEPARVRFLRRNPHAALTVDRYDDDWNRLAWVQVLGDVDVLEVVRRAAERARGVDVEVPAVHARAAARAVVAARASAGAVLVCGTAE